MRRHKTVARRKLQGFSNSALENTVVNICWSRFNIKKCAVLKQCVYLFSMIQKQRLFTFIMLTVLSSEWMWKDQILPEVDS